jgi:hypothetical protein
MEGYRSKGKDWIYIITAFVGNALTKNNFKKTKMAVYNNTAILLTN